jgi:chromosome segregation ATPase
MQQIAYFFTIFTFIFALQSCGSSCPVNQEAYDKLIKQMNTDSLFLADLNKSMSEVSSLLDQADSLTQSAQQEGEGGSKSSKTVKEKAEAAKNALQMSFDKISQLETELKSAKSSLKDNAALLRTISDKKKIIEQQQAQIAALTNEVVELKGKNENLTSTVSNQNQQLGQLNNEIAQARQILTQLDSEINQAKRERDEAKNKVTQVENNRKNEQLNEGIRLLKTAKSMKEGIFKGNKDEKAAVTLQAYEAFCNAHKAGQYDALTYLNQIESDSKLNKFLKGKRCN